MLSLGGGGLARRFLEESIWRLYFALVSSAFPFFLLPVYSEGNEESLPHDRAV